MMSPRGFTRIRGFPPLTFSGIILLVFFGGLLSCFDPLAIYHGCGSLFIFSSFVSHLNGEFKMNCLLCTIIPAAPKISIKPPLASEKNPVPRLATDVLFCFSKNGLNVSHRTSTNGAPAIVSAVYFLNLYSRSSPSTSSWILLLSSPISLNTTPWTNPSDFISVSCDFSHFLSN